MVEKERGMGCVVCMGEFGLGYLQERDYMEELAILEYVIEMDHEERGWECMDYFFYPMPPHVRHGLHGLPPSCHWSVIDF
jgi:hypothetical protein